MRKALAAPLAMLHRHSEERELSISVSDLRRYLVDGLLATAIISLVIFCFCVLSIASDIHAVRTTATDEVAAIRVGAFLRTDSLITRVDQALAIFQSLSTRLDSQLTQVRAQVHDANETTEKQTKALTQTTAAVRTTLEQTSDAIQQVADKPAPVVKVQTDTPAVVAAPSLTPTPIVTPIAPLNESLPSVAAPKTRSGFRWHWKSWPFSKKKKAAAK